MSVLIKCMNTPIDEIKIGDEVYVFDIPTRRGVVTQVENDIEYITVMYVKGDFIWLPSRLATKTGRHFSQMEEILELMKGE